MRQKERGSPCAPGAQHKRFRKGENEMAHCVETMAYAGLVPWHKLGTQVSNDLSPREIQLAAGLDWTVAKAQLFAEWAGKQVAVPGQYGLQRSSDGKILTIVSDM